VYDQRLTEPVESIHDRSPELIPPILPEPRSHNQAPTGYYLAVAPLEPDRNLHNLIDALYLVLRRYGARFQADWDQENPFQSGALHDFQLQIVGQGGGLEYLQSYAESQNLGEQIEFTDWLAPEELERMIRSAIAVVDIPLTGDASVLPYQAMANGVPAIYSRSHPGIDSLVEHSSLARQIRPTDTDAAARYMLDAARVPVEERTPVTGLAEALDPGNNIQNFLAESV